ncbi:hypothetical protein JKG47_09355 [Acidithiobacillus sp. MC6.1]|nr:hypothetical protein [Acidithiobacillus sp. MC6.1]
MEGATKKRIRRTVEQRLIDIEKKEAEIKVRMEAQIKAIEQQKHKLSTSPSSKKVQQENRKRFDRAVAALVPDWDERHLIAAIFKAIEMDNEALQTEGEALLDEHGKARRGRRPQKG